jgi:hypothetical protein
MYVQVLILMYMCLTMVIVIMSQILMVMVTEHEVQCKVRLCFYSSAYKLEKLNKFKCF